MRKGIKTLCVTTWGAVLEVKEVHQIGLTVADPDAIDAGQYILVNEITLIARVKKLKDEQDNANYMLPNGDSLWGKD